MQKNIEEFIKAIKENEEKLNSLNKIIKKNIQPILDVQKTTLLNIMRSVPDVNKLIRQESLNKIASCEAENIIQNDSDFKSVVADFATQVISETDEIFNQYQNSKIRNNTDSAGTDADHNLDQQIRRSNTVSNNSR